MLAFFDIAAVVRPMMEKTAKEGGLAAGQTLTRNLHAASSTVSVDVSAGWNLLAVPVIPADSSKGAIFSAASSSAFAFQAGYVARDTLTPGVGLPQAHSSSPGHSPVDAS